MCFVRQNMHPGRHACLVVVDAMYPTARLCLGQHMESADKVPWGTAQKLGAHLHGRVEVAAGVDLQAVWPQLDVLDAAQVHHRLVCR